MTDSKRCTCPVGGLEPDNLTGEFICSVCGKEWVVCGPIHGERGDEDERGSEVLGTFDVAEPRRGTDKDCAKIAATPEPPTPGPSDQAGDVMERLKDRCNEQFNAERCYHQQAIFSAVDVSVLISEIEKLRKSEKESSRMDIEDLKKILDQSDEIEKLRSALHYCAVQSWEGGDIDGGYFQDMMVEKELMIEVHADEAFRNEWDSDTMYVLAWSPLNPEGQS